jgi:hypothetical protein
VLHGRVVVVSKNEPKTDHRKKEVEHNVHPEFTGDQAEPFWREAVDPEHDHQQDEHLYHEEHNHFAEIRDLNGGKGYEIEHACFVLFLFSSRLKKIDESEWRKDLF